MASIIWDFVVVSFYLSLLFYATFLILADILFALSIGTIGIVISVIVLLKFSLPRSDNVIADEFFNIGKSDEATTQNSSAVTSVGIANILGLDDCSWTPARFLVSHRTTALDAPENSISGIRAAKVNGFNAVEFDVRCTKDGIPVLLHDSSVERTTGSAAKLSDLDLNEVRSLDISTNHRKHADFKGETIPTLDEAIKECLRWNLKMFIDIKEPNAKTLGRLLERFRRNEELQKRAMIVCWSPLFLYKVRRSQPSLLTGLVWRPKMVSVHTSSGFIEHGRPVYSVKWKQVIARVADVAVDWLFHYLLWYLSGVTVVLAHKDAINRFATQSFHSKLKKMSQCLLNCRLIRARRAQFGPNTQVTRALKWTMYLRLWQQRGVNVFAWPVNDPVEKEYFRNVLKIDYLTDTYVPNP